jgi:hypothetical protein
MSSPEESPTLRPAAGSEAVPGVPAVGAAEGRQPPLSPSDIQRVLGRLTGAAGQVAKPAPKLRAPQPPMPQPADLVKELGQRFTAWRRRRLGLRGTLLYLLPLPLPLAAVVALASGDFGAAVFALAAFSALVGGAYLNRRALREQLLAPERRFSRAASIPYGYLAAALVAAGTAIAASGVVGHDTLVSATFALLAAVGFHLSYPLPTPRNPLRRPEREPADARVRSALEKAEGRILAIELAAEGIGNPELEQRLRRIASQGRGILEIIAERPAELFGARKFLNVYLEGADRVASRYVQTHRVSRSRVLESNFRNVLVEIENVFEHQRTLLLERDVDDLDIQIEVLRKQLEHEGIS